MNDQTFTRRAIMAQRASGNLRARMYREIGLRAVAEALDVEMPPLPAFEAGEALASLIEPETGREVAAA